MRDWLREAPAKKRLDAIKALTPWETEALLYDWELWARDNQLPPSGNWRKWLCNAGRGWGKTRTGAEWVKQRVKDGYRRIALVGRTSADVRDVMICGESGLMSIYPGRGLPRYVASRRSVEWPNGAIATCYSADKPDQLRGPQHDTAWADELASWQYRDAWDQLMFGLRLGDDPRVVITTTPRPTPIIKEIIGDPSTVVVRGSTFENKDNLGITKYGTAESGDAIGLKMTQTTDAVQRKRMYFDTGLKNILHAAQWLDHHYGGNPSKPREVSVTWPSPVPMGTTETTRLHAERKREGLESRQTAVRAVLGLEGEALREEIDAIREDGKD